MKTLLTIILALAATVAMAIPVEFNLSWTDNADNEEGFRVYVKVGVGTTFVLAPNGDIPTPNTEAFTVSTDLAEGSEVFFYVTAYNTFEGLVQESAPSNIAQATVMAPPVNPGFPAPPSGTTVIVVQVTVSP